MDTARYIRITNLCMLFFRAEGIAFSLYDKRDTCHLQYPEEPQRNTAALFAGRDPARTLDIWHHPQPCRLCFHPPAGRLAANYRSGL